MNWVYRIGISMTLLLAGAWWSHERLVPFPAIWALKQQIYTHWQRDGLLNRLNTLGYQQFEGQFAGHPEPLLLRVSSHPEAPLLLDLHPWNADWLEARESLLVQVAKLNWHVLRPNFGGSVHASGECCGDQVVAAIDYALQVARQQGVPATAALWVVGESGGGMTAACWMAKSHSIPAAVQLWVPVVDLGLWRRQVAASRPTLLADLDRCTANGTAVAELSPNQLIYSDKLRSSDIEIFAGIHDGYAGSVPFIHSLLLYQQLAQQIYQVEASTMDFGFDTLLQAKAANGAVYPLTREGRSVLFRRQHEKLVITLFDGGHELLEAHSISRFCEWHPSACHLVEGKQ